MIAQGQLHHGLARADFAQADHLHRVDIEDAGILRRLATQTHIPGGNTEAHRFIARHRLCRRQPEGLLRNGHRLQMILAVVIPQLAVQQGGGIAPLGQRTIQPGQLLMGLATGHDTALLHQPNLPRQGQ